MKPEQKRTDIVVAFCRKNGFSLVPLNNGYQLRIENVIDVYPTNGRWCWLQTGERGDWNTAADLRKIMLKHLPAGNQYADQKEFMADEHKFDRHNDMVDATAYAFATIKPARKERDMKKLTSGHLALIGVGLFVLAGITNIFVIGVLGAGAWIYALYIYATKERKAK